MEGLSPHRAAPGGAPGTLLLRRGSRRPQLRLVLWRHGRTAWNVEGRFQGHLDIGLDDTGRAQAASAARLLRGLRPDLLVASDSSRATSTADALAAQTGLPVRHDAALRETFGGSWEGLTTPEIIAATPPAEWEAWVTGSPHARPTGGESRIEVADRMAAALERALAPLSDGGTLVVVTHGGAARGAIGRLLDLPPHTWSRIGGLANCCWSVLSRRDGRWRLDEHNAGSLPAPVLTDQG